MNSRPNTEMELTRRTRHPGILFLLFMCFASSVPAHAQSAGPALADYGIGVVRYAAMYSYTATDAILTAPSRSADTVAILARDSLCFAVPRHCVRSYERMVEFDYEVPGWAIRRFTPDSAWVEVTLAPADPRGPVGWVRLRPDTAVALLWAEVLPRHALFFRRPDDIAFYSRPDRSARVSRPLVPHPRPQGYDYSMHPLGTRGRWLRVQVVSPSDFCDPQPTVKPDTLWIQYLTPTGRPRVFYYSRGC